MSRYEFRIATAADERDLREFSRAAGMPGAMRLALDRSPDYFASLRPEGDSTEVLICRDGTSGQVVGVGHRSLRRLWVNGVSTPVGYLGGLRLHPAAQRGTLLARGYDYLRQQHGDGQARFYLSTVMEENGPARGLLQSGGGGLPRYRDLGRFCAMAVATRSRPSKRVDGLCLAAAGPEDAPAMLQLLDTHRTTRQFSPVYPTDAGGSSTRLLPGLAWRDVTLAWRGSELVGMAAAWDQRAFRRWSLLGYAPWLRLARPVLNLAAACRGLPRLPRPGEPLDYFVLALVCIQNEDLHVFQAVLEEIVSRQSSRFGFFLAGLHQRDPLLPVLERRPHVALPSRLFAVSWEDGAADVAALAGARVPYLELGSL